MKRPTIIQTPDGEAYGTTRETPAEAAYRLTKDGALIQVLDNVVRIVRYPIHLQEET